MTFDHQTNSTTTPRAVLGEASGGGECDFLVEQHVAGSFLPRLISLRG
jgi:hypothetical protein